MSVKKLKGFLLLTGLAFLAMVVSPNVGTAGLLDKVKKQMDDTVKGVKRDTGATPGSAPSQGESTPSGSLSGPRGKATPHPSGNPPGLMFSTVLNGVNINYKTGKIDLRGIQAVFLPTPPTKSKSIYPYDPTNGGGLIWADLKNSSGALIAKFEFTGEKLKDPYWLLSSARCNECEPGNRTKPMAPGQYTLDFYVENEHFYHFPFSVSKLKPASAFDGGDFYFIDGDWEKWGYLYYFEANPDKNLTWKIWLRNKATEKRGIDGKVDVTIYRGGKPIAKSRPATHTLKPWWIRFAFELIEPMKGTSGGRYFKASDVLNKDGAYTLKVVINGKAYGTWNFSVEGGKLNYTGRTVRGKADRLTFIEGGKDAWWYEKK